MMFVLTAVLSAWAQDVWDGSIATEFAGGSGTQDDPYLISDGAELAYLSKITNEDASQTQGKYYRLTSDIILNENVLNKDYELNGTPANLWTPIADVTYYGIGNGSFYGDFNGDGYVISGLYCYNSSSGYVYCGLFGSLGGDAVVHNVAIIDSYSKCTSYTSGLVAANLTDNAVVRCCYVDGYSYGGQYGGLLVGTPTNYMNTLIEYCYTKGVSNGGGLTGYMSSSNAMRKCYAVALGMSCVVKQVTGYKELTDLYYDSTLASISDSYATGKTTTEMQSKEFAELLGEPFVYEQGNYPGIEGLPAIGETSNNKSGYKINVGDLTNGGGSKIKFYSFYDGTSLKKSVRRAEADMTVYLQVNIASNLLLAEADLKVTNDETGISIALKKEADGIWSFTMPETSVTTTARFYKNPHAAGVWDGSVATSFAGGTGRADDPYLISNGEELAYLAQITKANPNQTSGKFYRLTDNILLNEDVLTDDFSLNGTPENGWMPIGDPDNTWDYTGNGFKGNFDGAGYCVSGLYCVHNGQIIGLFGSIESSAEIHDLSVVDSYVSGGRFTGAIAGGNNGGKIYRCYAEAYVCNADYAGVAVGHTEGTVEYCYASGRVEGSNRGGVLGWVNYGSYANCFSTVIGGGTSGSRTGTNSYYDSNINTSGGYGTAKTTAEMQSEEFTQLLGEPFVYAEGYYPYIEGLLKIGEQPIFSSAGYRLSVGKLTNGSGSALTFHTSYDDAAAGKNTRSMEAGQTVYLKLKPRRLMFLADGTLKVINDSTGLSLTLTPISENIWSFIMPAFSVTASAGFYRDPNAPLLWDGTIAQTFAGGDGSEDDPYLISTPDELAYLSQLTNANGTLTQGKYYQLAADICLNDQMLNGNYELEGIPENVWTPIGNSSNNSFKGVFDGNNHTISGVYIPDGNDCSGLFGTIDGATVNDLSLIDTYVKGSNYTGGLVGQVAYNDSCFIKRCYVEANVTSTNSYSGVLAGYSYYYGVIENCYAAGRASASSYPAGICGQNYYSKVHNCFSAVTGAKAIGYDWYGTNTNVYHDSNLTGSTFNSGDLFRSAETTEMLSTDFAARMGEPFEYSVGYYPYIYGLHKIDKNGKTAIMTGYSLLLGTLTNGSGCSIAFYRNYTGKTGELADVVKSGEKVLLNGSTKIYAKVTVADGKLLSGNGLSVIATTGGEIAVTEITAGLYQFTMPESAVTVSAKFLFGGFCGRTDVNDGQNLIWSIDDGVLTFQQNTVTTGSLDMNSFTADGTPWHSQAGKVKAIDLGNATSIGDNAFANCISVAGIDLGATPITVGRNAFAKSTCLIVPAASYADYQTSWSEYASQLEKDKETLTMKEGQQWRTCYSRVGRTLPASLKAYIVRDIEGSQVITGNALDYIPAGQAVLIEHSDKTGITAEATTSGAPYSEENKTPVCQLTTSEANLLQWLDSPMNVSAAQGYTLYKDEFVMVSSGILPAGIAFLPAQGGSGASSLSIFATENNMTAVELPTLDAVGTDIWYTIDGKRLSGMPTQKGLYICNGRKVVIK